MFKDLNRKSKEKRDVRKEVSSGLMLSNMDSWILWSAMREFNFPSTGNHSDRVLKG